MEEPAQLAGVLQAFMARAGKTAGQLSQQAEVPKATIVNWQKGRVQRPRVWQDLLKVAGALLLEAPDTNTLLEAAGHSRLPELVPKARSAQDRALFARWLGSSPVDGPFDPDTDRLLAAQAQFASLPTARVPPARPLPRGSCMPLLRNPLFVGREEDLLAIAKALAGTATRRPGRLPAVAVMGLGGLGKTQLAAEFVQCYGQFFVGGVFWLNFADASTVPLEIASCGAKTGMQLQPEWEALTLDQRLQQVLRSWQSPLPRLLVFDNCEDEALFAQWRPPLGGCCVLLTSRRSSWNPVLGVRVVAPDVLPRGASVTLLKRYQAVASAEEVALDRIAAEVGDLPLALHLAGTYLARYRHAVTAAAYAGQLGAWQLQHPSLQVQTVSPTGQPQGLARSFAVSYEQLYGPTVVDRLARNLLAAAGYCAPDEAIPRVLLRGIVEQSAGREGATALLEGGLQRLLALGLVSRTAEGGLRMHRLIGEFVQQQDRGQVALPVAEQALVMVLDAANEAGDIGQGQALYSHLRFMLAKAGERQDARATDLHRVLGHFLWLHGEYPAAEAELEVALAMGRALLDYDPVTLAGCLTVLGLTFQLQSRLAPARPAFEQALATWEQLLGPEHEFTDAAHNNLGYLLMLQGDYAGAQQHFETALAFLRKTKGIGHVYTSRLINNLGYLFLRQGRYTRARRYLQLALCIRRQLLPRAHLSTATTISILGETHYLQADYSAAWACHTEALSMRLALLGEAHHDVADSWSNMGRVLQAQGDIGGAQRYLEQARASLLASVGRLHRDTAFTLTAYGTLLRTMGDYAGAAESLTLALEAWNYQGGADYAEAVPTLNELALVCAGQGQPERALALADQARVIAGEKLGATHPDMGTSLYTLGLLLAERGEREAAQRHFVEALRIFEERLGEQHPLTRAAERKAHATSLTEELIPK